MRRAENEKPPQNGGFLASFDKYGDERQTRYPEAVPGSLNPDFNVFPTDSPRAYSERGRVSSIEGSSGNGR